jgi:hypothetical protein
MKITALTGRDFVSQPVVLRTILTELPLKLGKILCNTYRKYHKNLLLDIRGDVTTESVKVLTKTFKDFLFTCLEFSLVTGKRRVSLLTINNNNNST